RQHGLGQRNRREGAAADPVRGLDQREANQRRVGHERGTLVRAPRHGQDEDDVAERGFILTPTYRIAAGAPHVHLHSVLESGEPALIIDERLAPYFFVRAADDAAVRRLAPGACLVSSGLRAPGGAPLAPVGGALPG